MTAIGWVAIAVAVGLTVQLSVLAALLDHSGPIRLRHWVEAHGPRFRALFHDLERFEAYRFLLNFLAHAVPLLLAVALWALLPVADGERWPKIMAVALVLVAVLIAELVSRRFAAAAERSLDRLTMLYSIWLLLLWPLLALAAPLLRATGSVRAENHRNEEEQDEASEDEIEAFLDVGEQEGILEPGEGDLIQRVIDFGDAVVRSVMTPRTDMVCAPADTSLERLGELFVESAHSRIPLFRESVDDICGVLHIRDVLGALQGAQALLKDPVSLALPPLFVPETKPLAELLRELQGAHQHMALVVDEYGGTAGLVTIEDLLEEIVGEIVDEHDDEEPEFVKLANGGYRLDGMASLHTLSDLFALELEDEPYETVGGMLFGLVGDLPDPGTRLEAHGLTFIVERLEERRVDRVRVHRLAAPTAAEDQPLD